jgi:hypothetical protein
MGAEFLTSMATMHLRTQVEHIPHAAAQDHPVARGKTSGRHGFIPCQNKGLSGHSFTWWQANRGVRGFLMVMGGDSHP